MNPRARHQTEFVRIELKEKLGFDVLHRDVVNINPKGTSIEVDFSATDMEQIVQVAIKRAYEAGVQAGEQAVQAKIRTLLGLGES